MLAAAKNKGPICELLLSSGADPTLKTPDGRDALDLARAAGAADAILVLERLRPKTEAPLQETPDALLGWKADADPEVPLGAAPEGIHGVALFEVDGEDDSLDLSGWETEEDGAAPEDNRPLVEAIRAVHSSISMHAPIDTAEDWAEFEASLPERAERLQRAGDEEGRREILRVLRRALREGSVPERELAAIFDGEDGLLNESDKALLMLVLGDLGGETDERIEPEGYEDAWEERDDDEGAVAEAWAFLEDIRSGRNEPLRFYFRDMRVGRLLTAEEELSLGREMEDGLASALDALASWPEGVASFLAFADMVRSGALEAESVSEGRADDEDMEPSTRVAPAQLEEYEGDEEGSGVVLPVKAREFLDKAGVVNSLAENAGRGGADERALRAALEAANLAPAFLALLADATAKESGSGAGRRFHVGVARHAKARERMVVSNLRLVLSVVKRYQGLGLPLEDLIQEGNLGLMRAVDRYDWRKGFRFSTYATWWIRQQASRAVADKGRTIRTPVHVNDIMLKIMREAVELEHVTGRVPSPEALALRLSIPTKKVSALMARMEEPVALHEVDSSGEAPGDCLVDESPAADPVTLIDKVYQARNLEGLLAKLDPRQAAVIRFRFGLGCGDQRTLEETGEHFGVTRERIRQIERSALNSLAKFVASGAPWVSESPTAAVDGNDELSATNDDERSSEAGVDVSIPAPKKRGRPRKYHDTDSNSSIVSRPAWGSMDRVIRLAKDAGAFVEDGRANGGQVVVRLGRGGEKTRVLSRELVKYGFRYFPGGEYRK